MGHPMAKNGIRKRGEKFFKHKDRRFDKVVEENPRYPQRMDEDEEDGFDEYRDKLDLM